MIEIVYMDKEYNRKPFHQDDGGDFSVDIKMGEEGEDKVIRILEKHIGSKFSRKNKIIINGVEKTENLTNEEKKKLSECDLIFENDSKAEVKTDDHEVKGNILFEYEKLLYRQKLSNGGQMPFCIPSGISVTKSDYFVYSYNDKRERECFVFDTDAILSLINENKETKELYMEGKWCGDGKRAHCWRFTKEEIFEFFKNKPGLTVYNLDTGEILDSINTFLTY